VGARCRARPRACVLGVAVGAARRHSAFPLSVPQGIRPPHRTRCGPCGMGAPEGGLAAAHRPWRCQRSVVAPCCSVVGLAIGQPSTEPNRRRRPPERPPPSGNPSS
jgi:hypothetical protein